VSEFFRKLDLRRSHYQSISIKISNTNTLLVSFNKVPKDINDKLEFELRHLTTLTSCGIELYNLVRDDLSQTPEEYVSSLCAELKKTEDVEIIAFNW
jgi:hypothetical protein